MSERVTLTVQPDGIAVLTLADERERNSFSDPFVRELLDGFGKAASDPRIKVCILRGLPEVFCAGAHLDLLLDLVEGHTSPSDLMLPRVVLDLPFPTIAAMEGHAVGGGLTLGLCCDMVVLARGSRYGCSFMNLGFTPGMGTTRLLQQAFGDYIANEMMLGGKMLKGAHFEGRSSINYVVRRDQVFPTALDLAQRIAEKPRFALVALKQFLSLPRRQAFEASRAGEALMHEVCFSKPETERRIRENYLGVGPQEP